MASGCGKVWLPFAKLTTNFQLMYPPEASGGYFGLVFSMPPPPRVETFSALTV